MNNKDIFDIVLAMKVRGGGSVTVLEDKTVTPDFSNGDVVVEPDEGYDALSSVTIEKDSDLVAENIKKDVEVFGITGTLEGGDSEFVGFIEGTLTEINNSDITKVGTNAFYYRQNLTSINLPNVTNIGGSAFYNCDKLTSLDFPNATLIYSAAFYGCSALTSINLPKVSVINMNTFYNCVNLTLLDFPNVNYIQDNAFRYCSNLTSMVLRRNSVCTLVNIRAFYNTQFSSGKTGGTLYVPQDLIASYQADTNWSTVLGWNANNQIKAIEGSIYE